MSRATHVDRTPNADLPLKALGRITVYRDVRERLRRLWNRISRRARLGSRAFAFAALLAPNMIGTTHAQSAAELAEYRVKAAFVYKFGEYVEWPGDLGRGDAMLVIGVIGADALADELSRIIAERTASGRQMSVRKIRVGEAIDDVHLLFVGRSGNSRLQDHLAAAKGHPILTVTESDQAIALGSMINFVVSEDKVRFDIALHSVEQGNIRISARLLSVARKVIVKPS